MRDTALAAGRAARAARGKEKGLQGDEGSSLEGSSVDPEAEGAAGGLGVAPVIERHFRFFSDSELHFFFKIGFPREEGQEWSASNKTSGTEFSCS